MPAAPAPGLFPATRWTRILAARNDPAARRQAMEELLRVYWRPIYVFVRRRGLSAEEAQDAVQELFLRLLEKDEFLQGLDPARGRLRSFLLAAASNHLANRHEKAHALKRGGGAVLVPLDVERVERVVAAAAEDPDRAFQQEWAASLLERVLDRLAEEFARGERRGPFEVVRAYFGAEDPPPYKETAAAHGMSVPQLKAFLHRARVRFRELARAEVEETVADPAEADAELQELRRVLSS